jgi:hypothetical protein
MAWSNTKARAAPVCFNNDAYWNASKRLVEKMAEALGDHPQLGRVAN